MNAREVVRRWDAAIERYHRRRPEDEQWRQRANAALAKLMVRVQELEEEEMADLQRYKGPYQVALHIDGLDHERVIGSGLDWQGAQEIASYWQDMPHVRAIAIRNEPDQQTVEIVYDRNEKLDDPEKEESSGDSTPVV